LKLKATLNLQFFILLKCGAWFSTKHPNISDMKPFFSHIGYIGKMKKNFHISQFQYPALVSHNNMNFN